MKLTHITTKENKERILKEGFKIRDNKNHFKPNGVWLSIDNGWEDWCRYNDFRKDEQDAILEVKLRNPDKYYTMDSMDDFLAMFHEFCAAKGIRELPARQSLVDGMILCSPVRSSIGSRRKDITVSYSPHADRRRHTWILSCTGGIARVSAHSTRKMWRS